jgi:probable HAF family extracellular repeat protein
VGLLTLVTFVSAPAAAQPSFTPLGDLEGGYVRSFASSVSADGLVVVGRSDSANGTEAFRWEDGTMVGLGDLEGGSFSSVASGVSADGSAVVGWSTSAIGREAFRWTDGTMVGLNPEGYGYTSTAMGVSADASVVAGYGYSPNGYVGFRWTDGTMVGLGYLEGGAGGSCFALGVSADGSAVVGWSTSANGGEAFRWTEGTMVGLGDLDGGIFKSVAIGVSADGSVVVGYGTRDAYEEAFRWTDGTMVGLGHIDGGSGRADGVSADGSVVVGRSGNVAFRWTEADGMQSVQDLLEAQNVYLPPGWRLEHAYGVSADGTRIVGDGVNPYGNYEAWLATLPLPTNEPPTANAGDDRGIRAGETVVLDGTNSFDDNTPSVALGYAWTLVAPVGTTAVLTGANTATPSLATDPAFQGEYEVSLVVTDEEGLTSGADEVLVSTDNLPPTANIAANQLVILGESATLNGSASTDPDNDPLSYQWSVAPGSDTQLSAPDASITNFTPDAVGSYTVTLEVSDPLGPGTPANVGITVVTPEDGAQVIIAETSSVVDSLSATRVTTKGNQNALGKFSSQAVVAIQEGDLEKARDKLQKIIERTDGCILRGSPDGNGPGRDWITDCADQAEVYEALQAALALIAP